MNSKILLVDDEEIVQIGVCRFLSKLGVSVKQAYTLHQARSLIAAETFDAILLDVKLPDGISLDLIKEINTSEDGTPVIVMSGVADIQTAVDAMRLGATNFITKPTDIEGLGLSIQKCLEHAQLKKQDHRNKRLHPTSVSPYFGDSSAGKQILRFAEVAAKNDSVVLLLGDTGTGKGVIAKWIHEMSSRSSGTYVELNCSALRGELLRSELYGHAKGAFTSAIKDREGLIEVANNGTLFLDEIGDMDITVQAELLKTIEEKKFRRIGENKIRTSNFRLICATNRKLKADSETGKFRSDLYYRICVFPITLPSLKERKEDIPGFLNNLLVSFGYQNLPLDSELLYRLSEYPWPGNIREMKNVVERALLLSQGKTLTLEHFPGLLENKNIDLDEYEECSLMDIEKRHILKTMEHCNDDLNKASKVLGISTSELRSRLVELDNFTFA